MPAQALDPDLVLSRHTKWVRDPSYRYSTLDGAEPDNLTAASAWSGPIPDNALSREAFIYLDKNTNLWIQAVPWNIVPAQEILRWNDMQRALGAVAVWYNGNAKPIRRRKTYAERELLRMGCKELTYVDLLYSAGLTKFGDIDLAELLPQGQAKSLDIEELKSNINLNLNLSGRKKYPKLAPGQKQRQASKPVQTPQGIFKSVTAAAAHYNWTVSKMSLTVRNPDFEDFHFIDREAYDKLISDVNTSE